MKTSADEHAILDTNVIIYAADVRAPQYRAARQLSEKLGVKGADVFDLAIAATAIRAEIKIIYTFDAQIFSRVPGLEVREPS